MKLKVRPEDFQVEEKLRLRIKKKGAYSVYRLEKEFWNTLDVVRELERRHRFRNVGRAGLKDRYSHSVQYLSTPGAGPKSILERNYRLTLIGRADEPVSPDSLLCNSFRITLRSLADPEVEAIASELPQVRDFGVPNYYDDQRFGSARHGQGFIARKLVEGHYNGALKLWLASPSAADDSNSRRFHHLMSERWGDWRAGLEAAPAEARPVLSYLGKHPGDFKGAFRFVPRQLLELFVNAYQSFLWNETLIGVLLRLKLRLREHPYSQGNLRFYGRLNPGEHRYLRALTIPAPGPDVSFASDRVAAASAEVMGREGLQLNELKLKLRIPGLFFKPYGRGALSAPGNITLVGPKPDELYPGRKKLRLSFTLPPGAYATIVIKRLATP